MMIVLLFMLAMGYAIGLVNASWIIHRAIRSSDLGKHGSGNLGARNLYDVTGNAGLAVLAALFDIAKGAGAVLLAASIHPAWYAAMACAGVGVVLGHNYNVLLKWKGGRGLATAAGALFVISPPFVITWLVMYGIGYGIVRKNIHVASMVATIATAVLALSVPAPVITTVTFLPTLVDSQVRWTIVALAFPIFLRFIEPVREFIMRETIEEQNTEETDE